MGMLMGCYRVVDWIVVAMLSGCYCVVNGLLMDWYWIFSMDCYWVVNTLLLCCFFVLLMDCFGNTMNRLLLGCYCNVIGL